MTATTFPRPKLETDARRLLARLGPSHSEWLKRAAAAAGPDDAVYLVGGAVRDLALGAASPDVDLLVVGDAEGVAGRLAAALGGALTLHPAFGTATIDLPDGAHLDIAAARVETYAAPAALPTVVAGDLAGDLARRDFSVNALAVPLGGEPTIIDRHGGLADLRAGRLEVLHDASFRDDPTRIVRGVELEARLGLRLSARCERLAREAAAGGAVAALSGTRFGRELVRLLDRAPSPAASLDRLAELGVLAETEAGLDRELAAGAAAAADRLGSIVSPRPRRWLAVVLAGGCALPGAARERLAGRLGLAGREREILEVGGSRIETALGALGVTGATPARALAVLGGMSPEELVVAATLGGDKVEAWIGRLPALQGLELSISGSDLLTHGAVPGRTLGRVLKAVRAARLDGEIEADQELAYALEILRAGEPR